MEYLITLTMALALSADGLLLDQCDRALGMESGSITDRQLTSSSSHNANSVGPPSGRIRTEHRGGAWCPQQVITTQAHEFLQVDLGQVTVITAAETQGRFGNGRGVEWAELYSLQFWRSAVDGSTGWRTYRNASGDTLLDGNENTYLSHRQPLNPPIIASKVRFVPRSLHPRTVCMRVELHGCPYIDDIEEYTMDAPDPRWPDLTYDGVRSGGVMERGLGQLADGHAGTDDVTGPEWVGWHGTAGSRVHIRFQFSRPRLLESVNFHISNRFTAGIRMFQQANLSFSMDGGSFSTSRSFSYRPDRDNIFESSRALTVPLYGQVARFVSIQLTQADNWLLLSEISFVSERAAANVSDLQLVQLPELPEDSVVPESAPADSGENTGGTRLLVILTSLGVVLMLVAALVGYAVRVTRRRRIAGRTAGPSTLPLALSLGRKTGMLTPERAGSWVRNELVTDAITEEEKRGLVDDMCRVVRLCERPSETTTLKHQTPDVPYEYAEPIYCLNTSPIYHVSSAVHEVPTASWENPNYRESSTNTSNDSSGSSGCNIGDFFTLPSPPSVPPPPITPLSLRPSRTAKTRRRKRVAASSVAGVLGTSTWESMTPESLVDSAACEVEASSFNLLEKMAEGRFSEIYVCEMNPHCGTDNAYAQPHTSLVATARFLRCSAPPDVSERLHQEADLMALVCHPHVVRLLGIGTLDDDRFILVEHSEHGDLNHFLRVAACSSGRRRQVLSLESLVRMASQIADGMCHLASLDIVHRDLAARNCLVGGNMDVKIGELGACRPEYASDYVTTPDSRVIPLRWRSPEGVFAEEYTPASDVWSFGVTLWEVLTWCRLQPLGHLTDAAVMDRLASHRDSNSEPRQDRRAEPLLPRPPACPEDIHQLMVQCWQLETRHRPSFHDIRRYLKEITVVNEITQ